MKITEQYLRKLIRQELKESMTPSAEQAQLAHQAAQQELDTATGIIMDPNADPRAKEDAEARYEALMQAESQARMALIKIAVQQASTPDSGV